MLSNLFGRTIKIFKRYGFTKRQIQNCLLRYVNLMHRHNCVPSFPITARILEKYPTLIKRFVNDGIEFAVHGYVHSDYTKLSSKSLIEHFEKAIKIFRTLNIPFNGFRCPYLKWNEEILEVMSSFNFSWDSSQTVIWDFFNGEEVNSEKWKNYQKILAQYKPYNAINYIIRPTLRYNFVEIPVSLPDDDILVDRLGIKNKETIENIWTKILKATYEQGEIFTLQLHPERISFCENALESILEQALNLNPPIWIASLSEIANWWNEKKDFSFEINELQENRYQVKAKCSERATLLVRNSQHNTPEKDFFHGYNITESNMFFIESSTKPVVGISENSSIALFNFLKEEGIPFEVSNNKNKYGIYLGNFTTFGEQNGKEVLDKINNSSSSLVRFWRWPENTKSAFAITGDIDSITSIDFIMRVFGR